MPAGVASRDGARWMVGWAKGMASPFASAVPANELAKGLDRRGSAPRPVRRAVSPVGASDSAGVQSREVPRPKGTQMLARRLRYGDAW